MGKSIIQFYLQIIVQAYYQIITMKLWFHCHSRANEIIWSWCERKSFIGNMSATERLSYLESLSCLHCHKGVFLQRKKRGKYMIWNYGKRLLCTNMINKFTTGSHILKHISNVTKNTDFWLRIPSNLLRRK